MQRIEQVLHLKETKQHQKKKKFISTPIEPVIVGDGLIDSRGGHDFAVLVILLHSLPNLQQSTLIFRRRMILKVEVQVSLLERNMLC